MSQTRAKSHEISAIGFDGLVPIAFQPVSIQANQANSAIQATIFLLTAMKIYRVIAGFDVSASVAGTCAINIVGGSGAETGVTPTPDTDYAGQPISGTAPAYPPPYATTGQSLFPTDRALAMAQGTPNNFTPTATATSPAGAPGNGWDALWGPGGATMTLRTTTNGSASGKLYVTMLCKFYDPTYNQPNLTPFNPTTDIP